MGNPGRHHGYPGPLAQLAPLAPLAPLTRLTWPRWTGGCRRLAGSDWQRQRRRQLCTRPYGVSTEVITWTIPLEARISVVRR